MTASPVRVGLVGCGRIARLFHLPVLAADPAFDLVAVADPDAGALAAAQRVAPDAAALADVDELIGRPGVEAVVVCAPTGMHEDLAVRVLDAGHHLYLEKPLALTTAGGDRVLAAHRRAGTVAMIGFNLRLHPVFHRAQELLRAGALGDAVAVQTRFCATGRQLPPWKQARATGGGALLDLASHHVDLVAHLLGDPVAEVDAHLRSVTTEDDTALVTLRFAGGVLAQSLFSMSTAEEDVVVVHGTRGILVADRYRNAVGVTVPGAAGGGARARRALESAAALGRGAWRTVRPRPDPSFSAGLTAFAAAVRGDGPASPSVEDGYRSLAVVLAAERSAATGGPATPEPADVDSTASTSAVSETAGDTATPDAGSAAVGVVAPDTVAPDGSGEAPRGAEAGGAGGP